MNADDPTPEVRRGFFTPRRSRQAAGAELVRKLEGAVPPRLRRQGARRVLVGVLVAGLVLSALVGFMAPAWISPADFSFYGRFFWMIALFTCFYLHISVRVYTDIEMDLLDERQLTMRDAAFADAYSILWRVITALIVLYLVWPYFFPAPRDPYRSGYGILVPLLFFTGFLPTMVLAWTLPSEQPEA